MSVSFFKSWFGVRLIEYAIILLCDLNSAVFLSFFSKVCVTLDKYGRGIPPCHVSGCAVPLPPCGTLDQSQVSAINSRAEWEYGYAYGIAFS